MDYSVVRESVRTRVQISNEKAIVALTKQLRSPLGVIPFLGAGVSAPLKYRQWGDFLQGVARENLGGTDLTTVGEAIATENYIRAADAIAKVLGERDFQLAIQEEFADDRLRNVDLVSGTLGYIPLISAGPVITTNFDRVIEHVFEAAGRPFDDRVYGTNPDEVIPAIQQSRLVLWKIHGDRGDRRTRVFSEEEYRKHYADLPELLLVACLNRPLFFIGCSLDKDRITEVLNTIRQQHLCSYHYGFAQIPETDEKFDERVVALRTMGVRPIWYPKGEHEEIERFLSDLVHSVSSHRLSNESMKGPQKPPRLPLEQANGPLARELGELQIGLRSASSDYREELPPYAAILDKIVRGRLAFFLGAGACMGRLPLRAEFYNDLIAQFSEESDRGDAAAKYGSMERPLAGRIPDAIPRVILDRLGQRSLLFLGSGLGNDSIESLVRTMHTQNPKKLSWAIQRQPRPEERLYWGVLGIQIVDIKLENFILELNRRLDPLNPSRADRM